MVRHKFSILRISFILLLLFAGHHAALAQKHLFTHYYIEDGLIESQVNSLAQDHMNRLWIATLGGACRFDGKEFTPFNREKGLEGNYVLSIFTDKDNRTWFGTNRGIFYLSENKIHKCAIAASVRPRWVQSLAQDAEGTIWVLMNAELFRVRNNALESVTDPVFANEPLTALSISRTGRIFLSVGKKGIYSLDAGHWKFKHAYQTGMPGYVFKILLDTAGEDSGYMLMSKRLIRFSPNGEKRVMDALGNSFNSIAFDRQRHLWLGTSNGCLRLTGEPAFFNGNNGFTDNAVSDIFSDSQGNLWFATNGDGIYKYEGDRSVIFDKSQGLRPSPIVMGITTDKQGHVLLGTDGGGLFRYDGRKISNIWMPESSMINASHVQSLYRAKNGDVWLCTNGGGLWCYDGKRMNMVVGTYGKTFGAMTIQDGTIWYTTPQGAFYVDKNRINKVEDITSGGSSLYALNNDSLLVGTHNGLVLIVNKKVDHTFSLRALMGSAVFCMMKYRGYLLLGTADKGLFICNMRTKAVRNYTTKDGLTSDIIYSMIADNRGIIWLGTEHGINKLRVNASNMTCNLVADQQLKEEFFEANQNAMLLKDKYLWVGNAKGVNVFNTEAEQLADSPPYLMIQSVNSSESNGSRLFAVKPGAALDFRANHVAINYQGVYLRNPGSVLYQYKLTGLNNDYCQPVRSTSVNYPSLPPGTYVFWVKAFAAGNAAAANITSFAFEISPPIYQTLPFKVLIVALLVLTGIGLQTYVTHRKNRQQQLISQTQQEQLAKLRIQTAEDFHDDLGNKLTRINVLADILQARLPQSEKGLADIIDHIKHNTLELYNGTKDILWAMDPKSDNLYETLTHIKDFGTELFMCTDTDFEFDGIKEQYRGIQLAMQYSRNLNMIFKELLTNALRHSGATLVMMKVTVEANNEITFNLKDNGKGFDKDVARTGHGLNNIQKRTRDINGVIYFNPAKTGTQVKLVVAAKTEGDYGKQR